MKSQHCFNFFDALRVSVCGEINGIAGRRFLTKYAHYQTAESFASPDLVIELGKFDWSEREAYIFSRYRAAENYLGVSNSYKVAHWRCEIDGFGRLPSTIRLGGNLPGQFAMIDMEVAYLLLWHLGLAGHVPVHASAVEKDGAGTVIAGCSGVGKTTLVGKLLDRGCRMISEDRVFLRAGELRAFRLPVNMKFDRADPGLAKLPASVRWRMLRNRVISLVTAGYVNYREPVPLKTLVPDAAETATLKRLVYLQSGPELSCDRECDVDELVAQIIRGSAIDAAILEQELTAYDFAMPGQRSNYWEDCADKLRRELVGLQLTRFTVPVKPSAAEWQRIVEELTP